jgi:hypothetical protein
MADSQMDDIVELEELAQQLIQQAAGIRQEAEGITDLKLRKTLLRAADEYESAARKLANGLRGMRETLQ